jgi:hypothetical protein
MKREDAMTRRTKPCLADSLGALGVFALFCMFVMLFGCGPKPDQSIVLWEQPSPQIAAQAHAREITGRAFVVLSTGSMEPLITGGDWIVVDLRVPYDAIQVRDLLLYQANWLPADAPPVVHMAAAKLGDEWIMDGIANAHYERGAQRLKRADYRGKVVQVYTKRAKT